MSFSGRIRSASLGVGVTGVIAMSAAGCGSSSGSANDHPTTAKQYAKDLSALCTKINPQATAALKSVTTSSTGTAEVEGVIEVEAPFFKQLESIRPPSGDSAGAALMTELQSFVSDEKKVVAAAKAKNASALDTSAEAISRAGDSVDTDFSHIRATACGD